MLSNNDGDMMFKQNINVEHLLGPDSVRAIQIGQHCRILYQNINIAIDMKPNASPLNHLKSQSSLPQVKSQAQSPQIPTIKPSVRLPHKTDQSTASSEQLMSSR